MKRIAYLFVILVLFTVGCSLSEASEDTTAFMSQDLFQGQEGKTPDIEVTVESVKCDVHPFAAESNEAGVTCRLEIIEDAALWTQSKEPLTLFASGRLRVEENKFSFGATQTVSLTGSGRINTCALEPEWKDGLFYPCGRPFWTFAPDQKSIVTTGTTSTSLLAEVPFDIIFSAMAYTQEPIKDSLIIQGGLTLKLTSCQGMLIPNSGQASIIMIGELKDNDSPVVIFGSFDSGTEILDVIRRFECDQYANQEVSYVKDGDSYVAVMTPPLSLKMDDGTVREVKSNIIVTTEAMVLDAVDGFIIYAE